MNFLGLIWFRLFNWKDLTLWASSFWLLRMANLNVNIWPGGFPFMSKCFPTVLGILFSVCSLLFFRGRPHSLSLCLLAPPEFLFLMPIQKKRKERKAEQKLDWVLTSWRLFLKIDIKWFICRFSLYYRGQVQIHASWFGC